MKVSDVVEVSVSFVASWVAATVLSLGSCDARCKQEGTATNPPEAHSAGGGSGSGSGCALSAAPGKVASPL